MSRNMYSIMLEEEIVKKIDKMAYENKTTRSSLMNSILADYFSYKTPEMRFNEMFETIEEIINSSAGIDVLMRNSYSLMSLRSRLSYKYNPTMKYTLELFRDCGRNIGNMKVSLRAQNQMLILYLFQFYKLWIELENKHLINTSTFSSDGRYGKQLVIADRDDTSISDEQLSKAIADYIEYFDCSLKAFLYNASNPQESVHSVEELYNKYYNSAQILF